MGDGEDFKFFSELSECEDLLTPEEQQYFDGFQYTRKSFAQDIVGPIEPPQKRSQSVIVGLGKSKTKKKRKKKNNKEPKLSRSDTDINCVVEGRTVRSLPDTRFNFESDWPELDDI